ncbi:MAG: arginine--tRNA ligase [Paracoccaceae bacterium]
MANLFADIRTAVLQALAEMQDAGELPQGLDMLPVSVEPPSAAGHGEMVSNAAMVLARPAGMDPRAIAQNLVARLGADARVAMASVAGPGFVNLVLHRAVWQGLIPDILAQGARYGAGDIGQGARVCVEFVGAYPVAPLQLVHLRGAVTGDAIARMLERTGHQVTREYYVNDGGAQADVLARSVYQAYLVAHGRDVPDPLVAATMQDMGARLKQQAGDQWLDRPEADWIAPLRDFAVEQMMTRIRDDLAGLGIEMDVFSDESALRDAGAVETALAVLEAKGLIYRGMVDAQGGKTRVERLLFRATQHGDEMDRPVAGADGKWTYFAPDIAYHHDKITRGFDALVDVFSTDHAGYVKRLGAVVSALSDGRVPLQVKLCQMIRPLRDGAPLRGVRLSLREVVEEAGAGVTRIHMLSRKNDGPLDFDLTLARAQRMENPAFAIQYALTRAQSVIKRAEAAGLLDATPDMALLTQPEDIALMRALADWPRQVAVAVQLKEPHRLVFDMVDLARRFHAIWDGAKARPELGFVQQGDSAATVAKIAMLRAVCVVILCGLDMIGVDPVDEMH